MHRIRSEAEIQVQHIVRSTHIEVLGIKPVVSLPTLAVDKAGLLITAGAHSPVVQDILHLEGEAYIVLPVYIP